VWKDYGISLLANWAGDDKSPAFNFQEILQRVSCEPLSNLFSMSSSSLGRIAFASHSRAEEKAAEEVP
jgi:hypothetical protein